MGGMICFFAGGDGLARVTQTEQQEEKSRLEDYLEVIYHLVHDKGVCKYGRHRGEPSSQTPHGIEHAAETGGKGLPGARTLPRHQVDR